RMLEGPDEDIGQGAEALGKQAQRDALSGARLAGDHREAAVGDTELDAAEEAVDQGRGVERLDRDVGTEGIELESIEGKERAHGVSSSASSMSTLRLLGSW